MEKLTRSDKLLYAIGGGFASNLSFYTMLVFLSLLPLIFMV